MLIIFGAFFGLATLYFWLQGGSFARVVMFLVLALVGGFAAVLLVGNHGDFKNFAGIGVGIFVAWLVSGLPIYIARNRANLIQEFSKPLPNGWHIVPSWRRPARPLITLPREDGRRF